MKEILQQTLMVTSFVFVMMLLIEYFSVLTRGRWQQRLHKSRWGQYVFCAFLGATPGCLGAFTVVAMYSHRIVTIGAVVATMIATSGDESYIMLVKTPGLALAMFAGLFVLGIFVGALTDKLFPKYNLKREIGHMDFEIHASHDESLFSRRDLVKHWRSPTPTRGIMTVGMAVIALAIVFGIIDHSHAFEFPALEDKQQHEEHDDHAATAENATAHGDEHMAGEDEAHDHGGWGWVRITMLITTLVALFIVATVPDHFLEEHLWKHVVLKHLPRIFLWVLAVIAALYVLNQYTNVLAYIEHHHWVYWAALGAACLLGLVPQSGPHMVFLALFLANKVPFSVLLASSIVQDGHGMLPLLAESRKDFIFVKIINLTIGAAVGAAALALGF